MNHYLTTLPLLLFSFSAHAIPCKVNIDRRVETCHELVGESRVTEKALAAEFKALGVQFVKEHQFAHYTIVTRKDDNPFVQPKDKCVSEFILVEASRGKPREFRKFDEVIPSRINGANTQMPIRLYEKKRLKFIRSVLPKLDCSWDDGSKN